MNSTTSKLATLLGTASLLTMANATAQAQMVAQAEEIPETVLITGSLIRGTAAVGVPVTNLSPQDFAQTGALTTSDLFRTFPAANVSPGPVASESGANIERGTRVNLRQLDTGNASRSLLMIDGVRFPGQGNGLCAIDPGIIPALSLERIDILVDGASATYGADAVGGVINIILKRGFDGAISQVRYTTARAGKNRYQASQLWGRTWDGGSVTLSYEWYDETPSHGAGYGSNFTLDFSPWGLDNRIPLQSSLPGTVSSGAPARFSGANTALPANLGTNCGNCFAIPGGTGGNFNPGATGVGPTAPGSAPTFAWAAVAVPANGGPTGGTQGTRNVFNPYLISYADAGQQRNGGHIAIDQRLTKDLSFFGTGFYSNRRAQFLNPSNLSPAQSNDLLVQVPTWNPYYPTGAPSNVRVAYNIGLENPSLTNAYELAARYQLGINFALPGDWSGQAFFANTYDSNTSIVHRTVNPRAVSAALGWTIPASAAAGTTPGLSTWVKPAGVPYLNVFCDPTQFTCNSDTTLNYISGMNMRHETMNIMTKQIQASGPIYDLPGGQVKMAFGGLLETTNFSFVQFDNTGSPGLVVPYLTDNQRRNVWAIFSQINMPIFSDMNAMPFFNRLEFEASIRHDQYGDFGGTTNPKLAFNWTPFDVIGVTFRGAWGTSFRAPSYGELSPLTNTAIACQNIPADALCNPQGINIGSATGGAAPVGSGAFKINPLGHASLFNAVGISHNGGSAAPVAAGLRAPGTSNQGTEVLKPEQAFNWALGIEIAPTYAFLQGLDIQVTWYKTKITSVLQSFGNPNTDSLNDPAKGFAFLVASDFAGVTGNANCATANSSPTNCAAFQAAALALLSNPRSAVNPSLAPSVFWINDGGSFNKGWFNSEGIDWNASYDTEIGNLGAFNVGMVGTYYLNRVGQNLNEPLNDQLFNVTINQGQTNQSFGVESRPRMKYRARLGWANGPWSVTTFMNYESHFFHTQTAPPNVNNQCVVAGSSQPGGTLACAITGYTNIQPPMYTFDLSIGYDTGDDPANDYLKNIGLQLVVQNVLDKHSDFMYRIASGGGNPTAYNLLRSNQGRQISFIVTKTW